MGDFTREFLDDRGRVQRFQQSLSEISVRRYADMAAAYEHKLTDLLTYTAPARVAEIFEELFPPFRGQRILELGAGTGMLGAALAARPDHWDLTGLDVSQPMLDQVRAGGYSNLVCHDVCSELPFPEGHFQGAVAIGLSEHILDIGQWFRGVSRVLSPGTPWVFTYVGAPPAGASISEFCTTGVLCHLPEFVDSELRLAGFTGDKADLSLFGYINAGLEVTYLLSNHCSGARAC